MGSCQSIPQEHTSHSNSTAITVKEKPTEEETKEYQPSTDHVAVEQQHNDNHIEDHIQTNGNTTTITNTDNVSSHPPVQSSDLLASTEQITANPTTSDASSAHVANLATSSISSTNESMSTSEIAPSQPSVDNESVAFDEEFKSTVKTVLLLLLDRLTRTMEYESVMFQELALATGLPNYMELFDYRAFELFLRDNFAIPSSPAPMYNDADVKHVSQYFNLFLSLAQNGTSASSTRTFPSRVAFTERLQSLCSSTASKLLVWCESPHASSEVKEHFLFFSKALEFARGDLINQPKLLYQNIDEITA